MNVLAIDPGTTRSGWVLFGSRGVIDADAETPNEALLRRVAECKADMLAIEMIASYGMAVGREVFETCVWVGRFQQAWRDPAAVRLVYRQQVKLHLCGSPRAKDPNIRQALIDLLGAPGTKKDPGATYGVSSHAWAALGVAVTALGRDLPQSLVKAPSLFAAAA